jgi:hypothetical protein
MSPAGHIMCIFAARRVGLAAGTTARTVIYPTDLDRPTIRWIDHPLAGRACRGVPTAPTRA